MGSTVDLLHTVSVHGGGADLVGREDDVGQVRTALTAGRGVVVTGEAGVGKTTLLQHALAGLGLPALTGRCFRSLTGIGAAPLQQALGRPVPVGDPVWTAQWLAARLGGRVLLLDDAQWADPLTCGVLELLSGAVPLAVTVRSGDPGTERALHATRGLDRIDLVTLPLAAAALVATRAHPSLLPAEAELLAERCGGNPLLIEQLGAESGPPTTLRQALVRRLRRMGERPWTGFALLARAGEPVPASWLPGVGELRSAGLVADEPGGLVRPWHPLLAEAVNAHLDDDDDAERAAIDRLLAGCAESAGRLDLAAPAWAACGERVAAHRAARVAADACERPGQRASLLRLAASCADGDEAMRLAETAVTELVQVAEYDAAADLLERFAHQETATWYSLVGRVRWQAGDDEGAMAAYEAGRALAEPGTREDVVLRCEYARAVALSGGDPQTALHLAREAYDASVAIGRERARALAVLGTVENFAADSADSARRLVEAVELAEHDPDADLQVFFSAANNAVAALEGIGDVDAAVARAEQGAARAEALHMRGWAQQMRAMGLNARMHHGDYDPILTEVPALLAGALNRRTRDQLEVTLTVALIDRGRLDAAEERITRALAVSADDHLGRGNLLWLRGEARLWSGDAAGALQAARQALTWLSDALALFPLVTAAHAQLRLGQRVDPSDVPDARAYIVEAAPVELAALAARSTGDPAAAGLFEQAAALWHGRHRRGEVRCRWLAADSAEDPDAARAALTVLEAELETEGWPPLLGQVRRSLRARGLRRSAARGRAGGMTLREREVMDLVGRGLSTEAIAARLGLSAATVAAQVSSARARTGAATRWQAASDG